MWIEADHPRDEYGRFALKGARGRFDRTAGGLENRRLAKLTAEWDRNIAKQEEYHFLRDAGKLTAEQDAHWDQLEGRATALRDQLPRAFFKGMRPYQDGTWRHPKYPGSAFDSSGRPLPTPAIQGMVRVGDRPDRVEVERDDPRTTMMGAVVRGRDTALHGGVWHRPGDMLPGGLPNLRNDYGVIFGEVAVREMVGLSGKSPTRQHRERRGSFARAEDRAERVADRTTVSARSGRKFERSSADVVGGELINALNPTSRRRTARKKRDRQQNVTWVQRLNDRMEYGRG